MWAIIKIDNKNLNLLKSDFSSHLGKDVSYYMPKIRLKKFLKNKTCFKEISVLGDYLLCYHKYFSERSILISLKYCKGLKYFLTDFYTSQNEIKKFIKKCKEFEDENGYLKPTFFNFRNRKDFEFISGPFSKIILVN